MEFKYGHSHGRAREGCGSGASRAGTVTVTVAPGEATSGASRPPSLCCSKFDLYTKSSSLPDAALRLRTTRGSLTSTVLARPVLVTARAHPLTRWVSRAQPLSETLSTAAALRRTPRAHLHGLPGLPLSPLGNKDPEAARDRRRVVVGTGVPVWRWGPLLWAQSPKKTKHLLASTHYRKPCRTHRLTVMNATPEETSRRSPGWPSVRPTRRRCEQLLIFWGLPVRILLIAPSWDLFMFSLVFLAN